MTLAILGHLLADEMPALDLNESESSAEETFTLWWDDADPGVEDHVIAALTEDAIRLAYAIASIPVDSPEWDEIGDMAELLERYPLEHVEVDLHHSVTTASARVAAPESPTKGVWQRTKILLSAIALAVSGYFGGSAVEDLDPIADAVQCAAIQEIADRFEDLTTFADEELQQVEYLLCFAYPPVFVGAIDVTGDEIMVEAGFDDGGYSEYQVGDQVTVVNEPVQRIGTVTMADPEEGTVTIAFD